MPGRKGGALGKLDQRLLTLLRHGPVGGDDLDEDQQWMLGTEVGKNDIGQILVGLDLEPNRLGELIIATHDLVPAFAQEDDAGNLEESLRKHLDYRFGYHRAWTRRHPARLAAREPHQDVLAACNRALADHCDARECAGRQILGLPSGDRLVESLARELRVE